MAQAYGLGNFLYELDIADGNANFKFWDADDANNTAEVTVSQKDFPEGVKDADSRQVADLAYSQCQQVLNDKRDARIKKEINDEVTAKQKEDKRVRDEAETFLSSTADVAVKPDHIERDGTKVYNTKAPEQNQAPENKKK